MSIQVKCNCTNEQCILILGYVYRLITLENNQALQFVEVAIFAVRGVAVFCTFLNPKTFTRIKKAKTKAAQLHTVSARRNTPSDSMTVEGSFTLQEIANGEVVQDQIPHTIFASYFTVSVFIQHCSFVQLHFTCILIITTQCTHSTLFPLIA